MGLELAECKLDSLFQYENDASNRSRFPFFMLELTASFSHAINY